MINMASIIESLQTQGWYITPDGLKKICENEKIYDARTVSRKALDFDIREIGAPILETELYKTNFGPVVLQVVKLRNASAPKSKQTSQGAPRMLKLIVTDGHMNCPAFEFRPLQFLNPDKTFPGTKLLISGAQVTAGSILLTPENCKLLGGTVPSLVVKWENSKLMPNHLRETDDGPPAWVNFGKKIVSSLSKESFKSLETKNKDGSKENSEFQNQRQDAIAEAAQGAVKKVFGGGVKPPQTLNIQEPTPRTNNKPDKETRGPRQPKQKGKDKSEPEKMEKPSQRVSLFDFLENKLPPPTEMPPQSKAQLNVTNSKGDVNKFDRKPIQQKQQAPQNKVNRNSYINRPESFTFNRQEFNNSMRQDGPSRHDYGASRQDYNSLRQESLAQKYSQDNRYHQNDRPPRFQKQQRAEPSTNKFSLNAANTQFMNSEPRSKPNTNQFVDKLTNEINTISLYNTKYENEKLNVNKTNKKSTTFKDQRTSDVCKMWKWKVGDRCMAKYWEDDKFYNAVVTGITTKTCMVEFTEYGNFEEVLHCDCIPVTVEESDNNVPDRTKNNNQAFSGSLEFRRGKNRPFVRTPNKNYGQTRNYES